VVVHFGDFTVDLGSRQLLRGTEEIHLGAKAFALLEVLLTKRPKRRTPEALSTPGVRTVFAGPR
jgi:DNA-binding response OmpR family regulator